MKILIIDDEEGLLNSLAQQLEQERYIVDIANDGQKGFKMASVNTYDLIILDLNLPCLRGECICKSLRSQGVDVPIIIISFITEADSKITLLDLGADDYLTKPFKFEELIARIKAVLRRPKKIQKRIIKIYDLQIELDGFKVERSKKQIDITPKEFELLVYLAQNKGRVISSEELIEKAWSSEIDSLSKVVKTHIYNLRKKINKNQKTKLIQTIKSRGYRL